MEITLVETDSLRGTVTNKGRGRKVTLKTYLVRQDGAEVGRIMQVIVPNGLSGEGVRWVIDWTLDREDIRVRPPQRNTRIEARYGVLHTLFGQYRQVAFGRELDAALDGVKVVSG